MLEAALAHEGARAVPVYHRRVVHQKQVSVFGVEVFSLIGISYNGVYVHLVS